jgi:hypothetical protein
MVGLLVLFLLAPSPARADEAEQKAHAMLQRLGSRYNPRTDHVVLYESAVTDDDLRVIAGLTRMRILNLNVTGVSDRGLAHLGGLKDLQILYLSRTRVTDAGLKYLEGLPRLRSLVLHGTAVGDAGLAHLGRVRSLEVLYLDETRVGDAGLAHLKGLTGLRALDLRGTRVTVAGLGHLRGLRQLRYCLELPSPPPTPAQARALEALEKANALVAPAPVRWRPMADFDETCPPYAGLTITIRGPDAADKDIAPLAEVPQLQVLVVRAPGVTDAGLAHVKGLADLEEVDLLCMSAFTDKGMDHFKGLTGLRRLTLDGTSVTDAGLKHLYGLKRLEYLRLGRRVTAAGVRDLRAHLPNTRVVAYSLGIW